MENTKNKLRVVHIPQVGITKSFIYEVANEEQAYVVQDVITMQHLWLFENKYIPDYANIVMVEMYDTDIDDETQKPYGWSNYYNEAEGMEWEEIVETYFERH